MRISEQKLPRSLRSVKLRPAAHHGVCRGALARVPHSVSGQFLDRARDVEVLDGDSDPADPRRRPGGDRPKRDVSRAVSDAEDGRPPPARLDGESEQPLVEREGALRIGDVEDRVVETRAGESPARPPQADPREDRGGGDGG